MVSARVAALSGRKANVERYVPGSTPGRGASIETPPPRMDSSGSKIEGGSYPVYVDRALRVLSLAVADGAVQDVMIVVGLAGYAIEGVLARPSAMTKLLETSGITLSSNYLELSFFPPVYSLSDVMKEDALTLIHPRLRGAAFPLPEVLRVPWAAVCGWSVLANHWEVDHDQL